MGKKKQTTNNVKSKVVNFYGTKSEWVKAELDVPIRNIFSNAVSSGNAVVAEDDKGLYVTCKTYVDAPMLDPYRMYNRVVPDVVENGYKVS